LEALEIIPEPDKVQLSMEIDQESRRKVRTVPSTHMIMDMTDPYMEDWQNVIEVEDIIDLT
jgi:hypothetical protein